MCHLNEVYIKSDFNICYCFVFIVTVDVNIKEQFPSTSLVSFVFFYQYTRNLPCLADQK